ncbi:MAG: PH domain-containing protein [Rothia sp. (in: high G+C Gram-positive bacteria)]|uniref:PH domain-containing protein n=1 Tax=Rothia sp. (in: high G+C Gram-positive bacteria) TaxID=1885016 RepID=UPI0026E0D0EE|nr:PH domain-containing protein [Rothia sp. (in: high G+C Gram-positive bacteria)]MDO5749733.1 PH domain-containing protein [Rothia sp. (in: high G+C Gram-positive bacteria)]
MARFSENNSPHPRDISLLTDELQQAQWWRADWRSAIAHVGVVGWAIIAFALVQLRDALITGNLEENARAAENIFESFGNLARTHLGRIGWMLFAAVVLLVIALIRWWTTRYWVGEDMLYRRRGVFTRQLRQVRYESIQSVELDRPLIARLLGLAVVRCEIPDGAETALRIEYVSKARADQLREQIFSLMTQSRADGSSAPGSSASSPEDMPEVAPAVLTEPAYDSLMPAPINQNNYSLSTASTPIFRVSTARYVGALLLDDISWIIPALIVWSILFAIGSAILTLTGLEDIEAHEAMGAFGVSLIFPALGYAGHFWHQFDQGARFSLSDLSSARGRGVQISYGLTGTHTQSVLLSRIQSFSLEQPLLWRLTRWYRMKLTIAGVGLGDKENDVLTRSTVLPVGNAQDVLRVLEHIYPQLDSVQRAALLNTLQPGASNPYAPQLPAQPWQARLQTVPAARFLAPLSARYRAMGWERIDTNTSNTHSEEYLYWSRTGWRVRVLACIPSTRVLALRISSGPIARVAGARTVHCASVLGPVRVRNRWMAADQVPLYEAHVLSQAGGLARKRPQRLH